MIYTLLSREYKRLQQPHVEETEGEEVDDALTTDTIQHAWRLLQYWRIMRSLETRFRVGASLYPIKSPPPLTAAQIEELAAAAAAEAAKIEADEAERAKKEKSLVGFFTKLVSSEAKVEEKKDDVLIIKHLVPLIPGEGLGEWGEVCNFIGSEERSLVAVAKAVLQFIQNDEFLSPLVHKMTSANITVGLSELSPEEPTSAFIASSLNVIADNLAAEFEQLQIVSLRHFIQYAQMLEKFRKDRIRKAGGKLTMADNGEVEVDSHGVQRVIPHADSIIDTDLLHGVSQRLNVHIAIKEAKIRKNLAKQKRRLLRGELACLVQYGFLSVVPFTQKVSRGLIAMQRARVGRRDLALYSLHAAAITLQTWFKAYLAKKKFAAAMDGLATDTITKAVVFLQAALRCWTKWHIYDTKRKDKYNRMVWFGLTKMQAFIRGFNARRRVKKLLGRGAEERKKQLSQWGAVMIQKTARGYIARKTTVQSYHIRNSLRPKLLFLAEKYLNHGNLWGFLKEIDGEFDRLGQEMKEDQQREDLLAETFVKNVLMKRQGQFDGAWDRFSRTAMSSMRPKTGSLTDNNHLERGHQEQQESMAVQDGKLSAVGHVDQNLVKPWGESPKEPNIISKKKKAKGSKSIKVTKGSSSSLVITLPTSGLTNPDAGVTVPAGPMLRRAITATVQEGVMREVERQKQVTKRSVKLLQDIQSVYSSSGRINIGDTQQQSIPNATNRESKNSKKATLKQESNLQPRATSPAKHTTSRVSSPSGNIVHRATSPQKTPKTPNIIDASASGDKRGIKSGKISAASTDWVSSSSVISSSSTSGSVDTRGGDIMKRSTSSKKTAGQGVILPFTGESLLVDVPRGIHDTIERLMRAAAIRSYVPDFFSGSSAKKAYDIYLDMPPGLPKMRYEIEAWKWCQNQINSLRIRGLVNLVDVLPLSKFTMFLKSVDTPKPLLNMCLDLVVALKRIGPTVPLGLTHTESIEKNEALKQGVGTVLQARAAMESLRPPPSPPPPPPPTPPPPKFEIAAEVRTDRTIPGKLLVSMVEGGSWCNLNAPIEDLITHAAFLVCPHVSVHQKDADDTKEDTVTEMGHAAFKAHTAALQRAETELERRELIRSRFRAALIMATPYCLRLKADGTSTVQHLVNINLPDLNMPKMLQAQVEALIR